jgi:hypothetical protein
MEPVEINAGIWYLRALRADDRIDDRPHLVELGLSDPDFVTECTARWSSDTSYSWAVCEPTTGGLLAVVVLSLATPGVRGDEGTAEDAQHAILAIHSRQGHEEAGSAGAAAVRRFAASALNIQVRG